MSPAVNTSCDVRGSRASRSTTTRTAVLGPAGRAVRRGSSASAVPIPTRIASILPRSAWTTRREDSFEIHCEAPVADAILPSSVIAHFAWTYGRRSSTRVRNGARSRFASAATQPSMTSIPAARSSASPPPSTLGNGSRVPTTTRRTPAAITARVQGGVLPKWQQGSSVTTSVAPAALSPARASACTSAWGPPNRSCQPSPTTSPEGDTSTAPTSGFGSTNPSPRRASAIARRIASSQGPAAES